MIVDQNPIFSIILKNFIISFEKTKFFLNVHVILDIFDKARVFAYYSIFLINCSFLVYSIINLFVVLINFFRKLQHRDKWNYVEKGIKINKYNLENNRN
jgi:hypothetical protein